MKITVTGTRGIPNILGGIETHCEELFPRIAACGYDITVVRRKSYTCDSLKDYKGVKLIDIAAPKKKSFEAIIHTVKALMVAKFRIKADIVHIHAVGPALVTPLARLLGMKVVFTHHGPDYERDKWGTIAKLMLRLGERIGCRFANEVIVISKVINDCITKKYGRTNAHLIYNGVPKPMFIHTYKYLNSIKLKPREYLFAMGRFVPEKNFHQLIEAFSTIETNGCKLVIAGDADITDDYSLGLKKLAKKASIILTGLVKGDKLHELLTHAKAFVLPSSHEGLPIALLEAMSYNLPVIVSNIPANKEIGLPADNYFQVGDINQLAHKLQTTVDSEFQPVHYKMNKYNWDKIAEQTEDVYKIILNHSNHSPSFNHNNHSSAV